MLGEILNAIGLPAAAVRVGDGSRPCVEAINDALELLLDSHADAAQGPAAFLEEWTLGGGDFQGEVTLSPGAPVAMRSMEDKLPNHRQQVLVAGTKKRT